MPHVVVRAVFTPGTTRCAVYNHRFNVDPSMPVLRPAQHTRSSDFLGCFIEIEVREYLSGIGPRTLTVHPDIGVPYHEDNHAFYQTDDYLTSLSSHVGDIWEGAEVVVWLGTHTNVAVESWRVVRVGYLQRDEAGEVFLAYLGPYPYSEDYDVAPYADRLKPTLVDYRRDIRLGIEESSEAVGLTPIGDANQGHLQAHLNRFGVYEMTEVDIVPPPPVPSE